MSTGFIKEIKENDLIYDATTNEGASGAPIILLKNNKVIGIHIAKIKPDSYKEKWKKLGLFIKAAYMAFNDDIKKK
jgi:V8-like Glu-specific endopeptidase